MDDKNASLRRFEEAGEAGLARSKGEGHLVRFFTNNQDSVAF